MAPTLMLADVADSRSNNFRIVLRPAAEAAGQAWQIARYASALAVDVFFVASGFLVERSRLVRSDLRDFVASRVLRIYIAASLAITLFIAGLSWHFIEEPSLRLKDRFRTRTAARAEPAS